MPLPERPIAFAQMFASSSVRVIGAFTRASHTADAMTRARAVIQRVGLGEVADAPANGAAGPAGHNALGATIRSWVYVGSEYEYMLDTPDGPVRAASPHPVAGPAVQLHLPPESIVVLRDEPDPAPATGAPAAPG